MTFIKIWKMETKKETVRKKEDDSSVKSVRASYVKSAITNDEDFKIRVQLDEADDLLEKKQAYKEHNHELLYRSITVYKQLLTLPGMPVKLMVTAGIKLADLHASTGQALEALKTLHILADKYPEEVEIVRELGITYMSFDRYQDAKRIFEKVMILKDHPHDGHAMAELGMIYGLVDLNPAKAIPLLKAGLDSDQKGTQDARTWTEGKIFVFDDSFQHAVWHYGKSLRLILIVDFWHPEMSESMRGSLH
nr:hypothetical protein BaRGS_027840 [Batillaria attramentaria]